MNIKFKIIKRTFLVLLVFLLFIILIPYTIPTSKAEIIIDKPFENSHFINVNDMRIHYRFWESKSDSLDNGWILLVHGMGGSTYSWEQNSNFLAKSGFNVIAVDVPPYGYSDRHTEFNHALDNRALLLIDLLKTLNSNVKWNLMGHSMGGGIVQAMSIIEPELIDKVVFVAPALFMDPTTRKGLNIILLQFRPFERLMTIIGERFYIRQTRIEKMLESAFGQKPTSTQVEEYYKTLKVPGTTKALLRSITGSKPILNLDGRKFDKNSLIVIGRLDSWIPIEVIEQQLKIINICNVIILDESAHCPMETHAKEFNALVYDFLIK